MSGRWVAGDPRLARVADLGHARGLVEAYAPRDAAQAAERARILRFLDAHPDALHRACLAGHLTAAALVLDERAERALLTHHAKLRRWLQLGGHVDGDANLPAAALREATEESGIEGLAIEPEIVDLDVHAIPARRDEPEHLHLDVRYLVHAPAGAREVVSDESLELGWFAPNELDAIALDDSVRRLFTLAFR